MAIGGRILVKYGGAPRPPRPSRDTPLRALVVLVIGLVILGGLFGWGLFDRTGVRVYVVVAIAGLAAWFLGRLHAGRQEDGILGVLYRSKKPMGSVLGGDEERSPSASVLWLLIALAALGMVALAALRGWPF